MVKKYVTKTDMIKQIDLKYTLMLFGIPTVVRATMMLNLLTACLQ
jgi:hypothetical protein